MQDTRDLSCSQAGCNLAADGTCLEGLDDPRLCPHSVQSAPEGETDYSDDGSDTTPGSQVENWMTLPGGYELTVAESESITAHYPTRLVVFAGEPHSGKTTLMATIFEEFSKDVYADHRFAGSETILAFERACFPSRITSGASAPDTDRTKYMRPRFFHLSLASDREIDKKTQLLLADISGEAFHRATDTEEEARKLTFISRADAFNLIIDGERITSRRERQDAAQRTLLLLRALLDVRVLNRSSTVTVILTKYDLLSSADKNTKDFVQHLKAEFLRSFQGSFASLTVCEVAARPQDSSLPFGFGVEDLVSSWLKPTKDQSFTPPEHARIPPPNIREADAFLWRQKGTRTP